MSTADACNKSGADAKLYVGDTLLDGSNQATIAWTEVKHVDNTGVEDERAEILVAGREAATTEYRSAQKNPRGLATLMVNVSDTQHGLLYTAYNTKAPIALAFSTGPIANQGEKVIMANWIIIAWPRTEPREGPSERAMIVRPACPAYYEEYTVPAPS